jgi:hypothetical protein
MRRNEYGFSEEEVVLYLFRGMNPAFAWEENRHVIQYLTRIRTLHLPNKSIAAPTCLRHITQNKTRTFISARSWIQNFDRSILAASISDCNQYLIRMGYQIWLEELCQLGKRFLIADSRAEWVNVWGVKLRHCQSRAAVRTWNNVLENWGLWLIDHQLVTVSSGMKWWLVLCDTGSDQCLCHSAHEHTPIGKRALGDVMKRETCGEGEHNAIPTYR